jgi:hypothetical protein
MFVIACKDSGCVQLSSSQDPRIVMALAPDVDVHYNIVEFSDKTIEQYKDKALKVVDGALIDLGYRLDLEKEGKIEDCGDCPPYAKGV